MLLIVDYNESINSSYERAKSLKSDGAKLQGLRLFVTKSASYEVLYLLRIITVSGGDNYVNVYYWNNDRFYCHAIYYESNGCCETR
jgi:hypothetical protein